MGTFELIFSQDDDRLGGPSGQKRLGSAVLLYNALWFTRVRWIVVFVFTILGLTGTLMPGRWKNAGLVPPTRWPWVLAGTLIMANIFFYIFTRRLNEDSPNRAVEANIWLQIIVDLIVVTVMVHMIGSTITFIAFTYLFHIALACIFFPQKYSLLVTLLAAFLYIFTVVLEILEVLPAAGVLTETTRLYKQGPHMVMIIAGSAVFVWLVVWYFISSLSTAVRKRDQQLATANAQLIKADEEKTQKMLITTHELKAPFAGIESNIQVLKYQFWNEIPESVKELINRIDVRAQTLRERITQILVLGDLKTRPTDEKLSEPVDLKSVMDTVIENINEKAMERNVILDVNVPSTSALGNKEDLRILFSNLVTNAIVYSNEGGRVKISTKQVEDEVLLSVSDYGIGIRDDALPHIFEEYYRTKEASKFNKMSTGLGLSIVKEIVRNLGLRMRVTSKEEEGTTFEVAIPVAGMPHSRLV
ncbi:MAG TPA: HAMP domain-containing histidine kinase [Spirochaetes bacterium]|nr:HAMP domain-containing histidine kinase [Spirochaetota bacterium]